MPQDLSAIRANMEAVVTLSRHSLPGDIAANLAQRIEPHFNLSSIEACERRVMVEAGNRQEL
jgi:hypothetical protein